MKPPLNCVVYKDGKMVSNRAYLKCLLNPLLRVFGYNFASIVENGKIIKNHVLIKCPKVNPFKGYYTAILEDWGDIEISSHQPDVKGIK